MFDLFGLSFYNNPDLRRLLTDYIFWGFPLWKDFPLTGFFEIGFFDYFWETMWQDFVEFSQIFWLLIINLN